MPVGEGNVLNKFQLKSLKKVIKIIKIKLK